MSEDEPSNNEFESDNPEEEDGKVRTDQPVLAVAGSSSSRQPIVSGRFVVMAVISLLLGVAIVATIIDIVTYGAWDPEIDQAAGMTTPVSLRSLPTGECEVDPYGSRGPQCGLYVHQGSDIENTDVTITWTDEDIGNSFFNRWIPCDSYCDAGDYRLLGTYTTDNRPMLEMQISGTVWAAEPKPDPPNQIFGTCFGFLLTTPLLVAAFFSIRQDAPKSTLLQEMAGDDAKRLLAMQWRFWVWWAVAVGVWLITSLVWWVPAILEANFVM